MIVLLTHYPLYVQVTIRVRVMTALTSVCSVQQTSEVTPVVVPWGLNWRVMESAALVSVPYSYN